MKTPNEIKKGLECSDCRNCPYTDCYSYEECMVAMAADALAYIQQLEATNAELLTKVEQLEAKCRQLERERDALLKYITDSHWAACDICKHYIDGSGTEGCKHIREIGIPCFEWLGVKEDEP